MKTELAIILFLIVISFIIFFIIMFLSNKNREITLLKNRDINLINTNICFDNAASTELYRESINYLNELIKIYHGIHRGNGIKSKISSEMYDDSRNIVKKFVDSPDDFYCIYTKNTTESLNLLSYLIKHTTNKRIVCVSEMEHHSNILSWSSDFDIIYIRVKDDGNLDINHFKDILYNNHNDIAIISLTGCSNVTGLIPPLKEICQLAHSYNLKVSIDGAQLIPHCKISMKDIGIDFLSFSAHKIYCPFGIGCLIGHKDIFDSKTIPLLKGGGQIKIVTKDDVLWKTGPEKFEAGSQNVIGSILLGYILNNIKLRDETKLTEYLIDSMLHIKQVHIIGTLNRIIPLISFTVDNIESELVSKILDDKYNISTRCGCFCAQIYVRKLLGLNDNYSIQDISLVRISLGMYNTKNEIDYFLKSLREIILNNDFRN